MVVDDAPERISVDEEYDVARMLSIDEFPPVIARLIGDEKRVIVLPRSGAEIYEPVVDGLKGEGASLSEPDQIK